MSAEEQAVPGGSLLASIDSISTFSSTSTQLYTSRVPPSRLRERVQEHEDSAKKLYGGEWKCTECLEINSEPVSIEEEECGDAGPEGACVTTAGEEGQVWRVVPNVRNRLKGWFNRAKSRGNGKLSELDVDCLSVQVARSNLQALHAFLEACPQELMGTCKNRVCRQKARLLARAEKYLGRGEYRQFYADFKLMLCQIQGDGSELSSRVEGVRRRIEHIPRLSREFQRLVALYCSEHGYLPTKGLDFTKCKYNPSGVSLNPEEVNARSQELQNRMVKKGLKIGRFEDAVCWMSSGGQRRHQPIFTYLYCAVTTALFAFMAGAYPLYLMENSSKGPKEDTYGLLSGTSPKGLASWVSMSQGRSFAFEYLLHWGGRYAPSLNLGQAWRWFTSPFVHQNFQHVVANSVLLAAFSGYSEYMHGPWRVMLVFFATSLGGNFLSACVEDPCVLVVGSSGAVFGFMGFFIADSIMNFETLTKPLLRVTIIIGFAVFFTFTVFESQSDSYVSHFSHVGGFLCGVFPSFLIIPNRKENRAYCAQQLAKKLEIGICNKKMSGKGLFRKREIWEESMWSQYPYHPFGFVGAIVLFVFFVVFPVYLYTSRLLDMKCSGAQSMVDSAAILG